MQDHRLSVPLTEFVDQLISVRKMTRTDQQKLMSVLLSKDLLTPEEQAQVNRVYDGVQRGWLKVVD